MSRLSVMKPQLKAQFGMSVSSNWSVCWLYTLPPWVAEPPHTFFYNRSGFKKVGEDMSHAIRLPDVPTVSSESPYSHGYTRWSLGVWGVLYEKRISRASTRNAIIAATISSRLGGFGGSVWHPTLHVWGSGGGAAAVQRLNMVLLYPKQPEHLASLGHFLSPHGF